MHIEKWFDERLTCMMFETLLGVLPADFPNTRELRIQIAKWNRLLTSQPDTSPARMLGMSKAATKAWLKEDGKRSARTQAQGKKVRAMMIESFKGWLKVEWPKGGKKFTNKLFAEWRISFQQGMKQTTKSMRRKALEIAERKSKPFARLGSKS
jgi:hypothetical protein